MLWAEIKVENFVKSIGRKIFTWNHRLLRISRCWCLKFDNSGNTESAFKIDWDTFGAEIDLSLALAIGAGSSSTDCWSVKKFSWNQFRKKKKKEFQTYFSLFYWFEYGMSLLPSWDYQLKCVDLDRQSQQEFWKETKSSVKLNEA